MYIETFEQAAEAASAALERMRKLGVAFTPPNFTVWYEHCSGRNPELSRTLDILDSSGQSIDGERSKQIHDRFFGNSGGANAELTSKLEAAADRLLEALAGADKNTANYGEALAAFSGNLDGTVDAGALKSMITDILSATHGMQSHFEQLQAQVDASTSQISTLREELADAQRDAVTDALTGISNRKWFDEKLRLSTTLAEESNEPLSLIMADIDHFKKLNDTYGHQVGDQVLRLVAQTLHQGVKGLDTAARYGGEEFAIILPNTPVSGAAALADALRKSVAGKRLVKKTSKQDFGSVTLSMGVTQFSPGEPVAEFLRRADHLLYQAKKYGRNRVIAESPDTTRRSA